MPTGTVKWFNNAKGYGFIIEDGGTEDLFAHFSSIEMDGYKTLKAGQAVRFEKQPGNKGTHAVNISPVTEVQTKDLPHDEPSEESTNSNEAIHYEHRQAVGA